VGTGGTISELLTVYCHIKSFRISCFKGTFKERKFVVLSDSDENWELITEYHLVDTVMNQDLVTFINQFLKTTTSRIPIYTGKMVLALWMI
jgi:hypothetical protein